MGLWLMNGATLANYLARLGLEEHIRAFPPAALDADMR